MGSDSEQDGAGGGGLTGEFERASLAYSARHAVLVFLKDVGTVCSVQSCVDKWWQVNSGFDLIGRTWLL